MEICNISAIHVLYIEYSPGVIVIDSNRATNVTKGPEK